jgi:hypothetical protein
MVLQQLVEDEMNESRREQKRVEETNLWEFKVHAGTNTKFASLVVRAHPEKE